MSFFAENFFVCSHSVDALMMMNPLFGIHYLGCDTIHIDNKAMNYYFMAFLLSM